MAGHELLSFLDANKGYHQIPIAEEDMAQTTFVTDDGIYCYTRMPFGLKNVGADFQEGMNKAFESLIGITVEIYADDIIFKSKTKPTAVAYLGQVFDKICKIGMKLNPKKCIFGISLGKCLGYMVSQWSIEANPAKIKAIQDISEPKSIKEVQCLARRIAS